MKWLPLCLITYVVISVSAFLAGKELCSSSSEVSPLNVTHVKLSGNQCALCRCQNGSMSCHLENCPSLTDCPFAVGPSESSCCTKCLGCTYLDYIISIFLCVTHGDGESWPSLLNLCTRLQCKAGIITSVREVCVSDCENPISLSGLCCPVCKLRSPDYSIQLIPYNTRDPCVRCTIIEGSYTHCTRIGCPVLNCIKTVKYPGRCCRECAPSHAQLLAPRSRPARKQNQFCTFLNRTYAVGTTFWIDDCSECSCLAGGILCKRFVCVSRNCTLIFRRGICCGFCSYKEEGANRCVFKTPAGLRRVYENGTSFRRSDCTTCTCVEGQITCSSAKCSTCDNDEKPVQRRGECCPICVPKDLECLSTPDGLNSFHGINIPLRKSCSNFLLKYPHRYHILQHRQKGSSPVRKISLVLYETEDVDRLVADFIATKDLVMSRVDGRQVTNLIHYSAPSFSLNVVNETVLFISNDLGMKIRFNREGFRITVARMSLDSSALKSLGGTCSLNADTMNSTRWIKTAICRRKDLC